MVSTKIKPYLVLMILISLLAVGVMNWGDDLILNGKTVDNDSLTYMDSYGANLDQLEYSTFQKDSYDSKIDSLLVEGNETAGSIISDVLAELNFFQKFIQPLINPFIQLYNFPRFVILSLNLPLPNFLWAINGIVFIIEIALVIIFVKILKGGSI